MVLLHPENVCIAYNKIINIVFHMEIIFINVLVIWVLTSSLTWKLVSARGKCLRSSIPTINSRKHDPLDSPKYFWEKHMELFQVCTQQGTVGAWAWWALQHWNIHTSIAGIKASSMKTMSVIARYTPGLAHWIKPNNMNSAAYQLSMGFYTSLEEYIPLKKM